MKPIDFQWIIAMIFTGMHLEDPPVIPAKLEIGNSQNNYMGFHSSIFKPVEKTKSWAFHNRD